MNNSDSATKPSENCLTLSPEEVEQLLHEINTKLSNNTLERQDERLIQQMIECLGDSRGMVRLGFAEALGKIGKPAVPFLTEALADHPNVVVQRAAAKTLTLIADPESIPVLIDSFLHDEDQVVRNSCIGALAVMGETVVPELLKIIAREGGNETIKGHAAWALAFIGVKAKEKIYAAIDSESADLRSAAVGALAKIAAESPEARAFELLIDSLQDNAVNVRSEAAAALGNLTYHSAIPDLIELLNNSEAESRKSAALALMKIEEVTTLAPLKTALDREREATVKPAIELAIWQIERNSKNSDRD